MLDSLPTILIIAALVLFFGFLLYTLIRDKKKGKSSCCGGCAGCAMAGHCHPNMAKPTDPPTDTADGDAPKKTTEAGI